MSTSVAERTPAVYKNGVDDQKNLIVFSGSKALLSGGDEQKRFHKLVQWWHEARRAQADNRMEMATDEDFYDGIQLTDEEIAILIERNQPVQTFNVVKNTLNLILDTERRARFDYGVLPRKKAGAESAKAKTKMFKYTQDCSRGEFERSFAFEECVKAGIGWIETGAKRDPDCPVFWRAERWRNMWFDHLGLSMDGSDWRFQFRQKWIDLDISQNLFPEFASELESISQQSNSLYPYLPGDGILDAASEFDMETSGPMGGRYSGDRQRVRVTEAWYRVPAEIQILRARGNDTPYGALDGAMFRKTQADHQYLVKGGYFGLETARKMVVRCGMWAGNVFLQDEFTPYNHDRLPFVPLFCYRRSRDNMPYGVIRDLRDPQSDLNKRRSKTLALLSSNQIAYEKGAVDNPKSLYEEKNRPDGMMEFNEGALSGTKVKFIEQGTLAAQHVALGQEDKDFIHSISGVTYESAGTSTKDLSGKAIGLLQQQGQRSSGVFFDNYYYAFQAIGDITISLIEQFFDKEDEYRITGDQQGKDDFVKVNEQKPDGSVGNAIMGSKADFLVVKKDYRETYRQTMLSMLFELIQNLSQAGGKGGEIAMAIFDNAIDLMDELPNREEIVAKVRKITGQRPPEDEMTPEQKKAADASDQKMAQEQALVKQLQEALARANVMLTEARANSETAKAAKTSIDGQMKKVETFLKALEAAGGLAIAPGLAGAADELIREAEAAGQPAPSAPTTNPQPTPQGGTM